MTQVAVCPQCRKPVLTAQSESWCLGCGAPLGEEIASRLPKLVELRAAAALEVAQRQPATAARWERVLRGMVGMGTVFGVLTAAFFVPLAVMSLLSGHDRDDVDFMLVAPFAAFTIAFVLGMLYAGLLAILARGRSFRELSIARVVVAGAVVGLIPAAIASGGGADDVMGALMLFPPVSATVATLTLLIARRAKPETLAELPAAPYDSEAPR